MDDITVSIEAKASTKDYPEDYMILRTTVDDFYNVSNHGNANAYTDYRVYIANVEGQNVYLPTPNSNSADNGIAWVSTIGDSSSNATQIHGIDTSGNDVFAKVYSDGGKIKCIYGSSTYTFNKTYNYWKK